MIRDYDVAEAAAISGLSPYMIDYLCRNRIIKPIRRRNASRGSKRKFRFADLVLLRVVKQILERGISVKRLKTGINSVRLTERGGFPERYLVTDGSKLFFSKPDAPLEDLSGQGQLAFGFIIDTAFAVKDVEGRIAKSPKVRRRRRSVGP